MVCKSCKGRIVSDSSSGDYVCIECGLCQGVIYSMTDNISYRNDDGSVTLNCQTSKIDELYPRSSMSTIIQGTGRMQKLNFWLSMNQEERSLWLIEQLIKDLCSNFLTESYIKGVIHLYNEYIHKKSIIYRGRVRLGLIGGCIYIIGVRINTPKTYNEISKMLNITELDVSQGYETLTDIINNSSHSISYDSMKLDTSKYIDMFCIKLNIKSYLKDDINKVVSKLQRVKDYSSHTPQSLIIGVIYYILMLNNISTSKKILSSELGVSEVTIVKVYKKLMKDDFKLQKLIVKQYN